MQGILDLSFAGEERRLHGSKVSAGRPLGYVQRERLRGVARAERCCPRCPGVVEDEMHIMECPLYSGPRGGFVACDAGMRAAMNGTECAFWVALARFLHDCMRGREDFTNQAPPAVPS